MAKYPSDSFIIFNSQNASTVNFMKLIFKLSNCEKIGRVLEAVLDVVAHSHRQGARPGLSEFRSHKINNEFHVAVADGFSLKLCKI